MAEDKDVDLKCQDSTLLGVVDYVINQVQPSKVVLSGEPCPVMKEAVIGSESNSFFSSLELQSKFPISGEIKECIDRNSDVVNFEYITRCFSNDDENLSIPPRSHTGGKWKPGSRPNVESGYRRNKLKRNYPTRRSNRAVWKGLPEGCQKSRKKHKLSEGSVGHNYCNNDSEGVTDDNAVVASSTENDTVENEKKLISCYFCAEKSINFTSKLSLIRHCKQEHKNLLLKCSICNFKAISKEDLKRHSLVKHRGEKNNLKVMHLSQKCSQCEYTNTKRTELLLHITSHNSPVMIKNDATGEVLAKYKCPVCSKLLRMPSLRQHLYKHTGDRHYECNICNRQFIQRGSLWLHSQTHTEAMLHCDKCVYTTQSKSVFDRHLLIHTKRDRPFVCETCGSEHFCKVTLARHKQIHMKAEEKPLKCTEEGCGKTFISRTDFAYHLRVHRNECPYKCDQCDYKGKTSHQLKKHKRSHTGEKPFKCSYCSYASAYSTHLTRHLLIHSGDKPYTCPYCSFKCNSIENIRKHILSTKKHSGKRVYPCKFCSESFNECSEFKSHLVSLHKEEFSSDNLDIASVIAGLYRKVNVSRDISNPIAYEPKTKILPVNDKSATQKIRPISKKSNRKNTKQSAEKVDDQRSNDISDMLSNLSSSSDLVTDVPEVVDVSIEHDVVTAAPCLSSDQVIPAEVDTQKISCPTVDEFSNSLVSVEVDSQQMPNNEALNFIIESISVDTTDQVELMHLVTLNVPDLSSGNHTDMTDENPVFIYV